MSDLSLVARFPHRRAGHCGSGALRDLLELHGLDYGAGPLSEGYCFGLGGGLGFLYTDAPDAPADQPPVYLVGRTGEMEVDFAANLGIGLDVRSTDDPERGWEWIVELIGAGQCPMVWADIAKLEYLRVRMTNTRHDIVIVGFDEGAGLAWIADNDREDLQPCSLESLRAARNSNGFPGPNRNTTFVYEWPDDLGEPRSAIRAGVERSVDNMLTGGGSLAGMAGAMGLAGVREFASSYEQWPSVLGDRTVSALDALGIFVVKAGTGGAMFRSLYARFLRDASELADDGSLAKLAELYDELAAAWVELAGFAGRQEHGAGIPVVRAIASLEREGVTAMQTWLRNAGALGPRY